MELYVYKTVFRYPVGGYGVKKEVINPVYLEMISRFDVGDVVDTWEGNQLERHEIVQIDDEGIWTREVT